MKFTVSLTQKLVAALQEQMQGRYFYEGFSSGNQELVLVFNNNNDFFSIRLQWEAQKCFPFFLQDAEPFPHPTPFYRFFDELKGLAIETVFQHPFNRSFQINFAQNYQLVFKLYDGLSNVLLLQDGKLLYHFRKNISSDYAFTPDQLNNLQPAELRDETSMGDEPVLDYLNRTGRQFLAQHAFAHEKALLLQECKNEVKRSKALLSKTQQALEELAKATPLEEIGHILMANLHNVEPGAAFADLFDFYRNSTIHIKLNKDLNVQQNAEAYYRKARNRKIEEEQLQKRIVQAQESIRANEAKLLQTEAIQSLKELRRLRNRGESENIKEQAPFKQFELDGFVIWVGKSAANNDLLTMRHSHKNDLWLHARDVSGSHVVVRHRQGKTFPQPVIEYAAKLAAYYSKAKGSSLVPVVYTERKFVRKPKGAEVGEVMLEKEQVLLVEPAI